MIRLFDKLRKGGKMAKRKKVDPSKLIVELKEIVDSLNVSPVGDSENARVARINEIFEKLGV